MFISTLLLMPIPCDDEHHAKFKVIAANERVTMKELFHKWVDNYPTGPNKYKIAERPPKLQMEKL